MQTYLRLTNPVMKYPWGSFHAIQDLLNETHPGEEPIAELWMGAHPKAPSMIEIDGGQCRLDELIREHPLEILGAPTAARYANQLPFLFKVLAARQPLSIQAHPDAEQARAGFERENKLGIPLLSAQRNYRDANPKPECICALSEFWAVCGFRLPGRIADMLDMICPGSLSDMVRTLRHHPPERALKSFFTRLMQLSRAERLQLVGQALDNTVAKSASSDNDPVAYWIHRIAADYPDDIGVLAPLFLHLLHLMPGQATFLPARCLHAYLEGTGIEIMASSDNVLRGGLTSKHVDVNELLQTLSFDPWQPKLIRIKRSGPAQRCYPCPADEFQLSLLTIGPDAVFQSPEKRNVEILLCIRGETVLSPAKSASGALRLVKGNSVLIPAAAPAYIIKGDGELYRSTVPRV